jgi:hypothetical protein
MGFEGTEVTPQIRKLISEHHIGSILLKASNLKCKLLLMFLLHEFTCEHDCPMLATLFAVGYRCYNTMSDYHTLSERSEYFSD